MFALADMVLMLPVCLDVYRGINDVLNAARLPLMPLINAADIPRFMYYKSVNLVGWIPFRLYTSPISTQY